MMKNKIVSLLLFLQIFSLQAQQASWFNDVNINIEKKKLLILGEYHNLLEFFDAQYFIIEHVVLQNRKVNHFQLLLENSPCLNYYLDKLIIENDSLSLKKYLLHRSYNTQDTDTLCSVRKAHYDFYMKFYYLSKLLENRTFRFKCYDNSYGLRALVFTISDILKKYTIADTDFLAQRSFLDSLLQKEYLRYEFSEFHQHFGSYFAENRELFQETLSETDFYWLSEFLQRSPVHVREGDFLYNDFITPEREVRMFEQINNSYDDSIFSFCIIGSNHINKPYDVMEERLFWKFWRSGDTTGNTPSVGRMLETFKESHFKQKIVLCNMIPLVVNERRYRQDGSSVMRRKPLFYPYPSFLKHKEYLNSLLTGNVTLIDMRKTKIRRAHKITDYMIVVKEANSVM